MQLETRFRRSPSSAAAALLALVVSFCIPAAARAANGLVLSEVLYDAEGSDGQLEWIELFNGSDAPVALAEWSLGWGGSDYTAATLALGGQVEAGAYFVVGGPESGDANGNPAFDWPVDLAPDLQNSGAVADGVALFALPAEAITAESVPESSVIYGEENTNALLDASGLPGWVDVADAPSGASVERDESGGWAVQLEPTPGEGPLPVPEPRASLASAAIAIALAGLRRSRR